MLRGRCRRRHAVSVWGCASLPSVPSARSICGRSKPAAMIGRDGERSVRRVGRCGRDGAGRRRDGVEPAKLQAIGRQRPAPTRTTWRRADAKPWRCAREDVFTVGEPIEGEAPLRVGDVHRHRRADDRDHRRPASGSAVLVADDAADRAGDRAAVSGTVVVVVARTDCSRAAASGDLGVRDRGRQGADGRCERRRRRARVFWCPIARPSVRLRPDNREGHVARERLAREQIRHRDPEAILAFLERRQQDPLAGQQRLPGRGIEPATPIVAGLKRCGVVCDT